MLSGKTILLGVTGGIAAYKAAALASALVKLHASVEVVMTRNATQFITPLTFEQLTGNRTMVDTFDRNFSHQVEHIALADQADLVLVASGSVAGTTRVVVDELRGQGRKVGMIKLKSFRPFPKEFFASIGGKFKALGVIDKSVSFGYDGTIFGDVKSSMYGQGSTKTANFICGLGGRDVSKDMIAEMFGVLQNLSDGKSEDEVQFIGKRW